jgi:CDGSH-type Zn-finger protein
MNQPLIASRVPCVVDVEKGRTYWWCACGRSRTQPWCDGSHAGSGFMPLAYVPKYSERVWLCACKCSRLGPVCDASHNRLPPQPAENGA